MRASIRIATHWSIKVWPRCWSHAVTVSLPTAVLATMCSVPHCIKSAFCRSLTFAACGTKRISAPDQLQAPTRSMDDTLCDSMLGTKSGDFYCKCPDSGEIRLMSYQGGVSRRGTLKWAWPRQSITFTARAASNVIATLV